MMFLEIGKMGFYGCLFTTAEIEGIYDELLILAEQETAFKTLHSFAIRKTTPW